MKKITYTLFFVLITTIGFSQQNYFVSTSGNDDTGNGSLDNPWETIQNSLDNLSAGDTLNILAGTYNEKLFVEVSGTEGSNIVIRNYMDDEVTISGEGIADTEAIIEIYEQSNITIHDLIITNSQMPDAKGILIDGNCDNITIKNNKIFNINFSGNAGDAITEETNAQPIIVFGSHDTDPIENLVIDGNEVYDSRTGYSEALAVNGNVDGFDLINNYVHHITNIGIDIIGHEGTCGVPENDQARNGIVKGNTIHNCISDYASSGGIYVDGGKNIKIENNTGYHNGYGVEIGCENTGKTTSNIIVRNNLFYDNQVCGIAIGGFDYPDGSGKVTDCIIRNNTCVKNDFGLNGTGELYVTYAENLIIENNLFYISDQNVFGYAELSQVNLVMNYNLLYTVSGNIETDWNGTTYNSFSDFKTGTSSNENSIVGDPLLVSVNVASPDFHLQNTSPAINAGNPTTSADENETDIDGEERVFGNRVDIGADETDVSGSGIIDNEYINDINLYPNPGNEYIVLQYDDMVNSESLNYTISNFMGQTIVNDKLTGAFINIAYLNSGSYIIHIHNNSGNTVMKGKFIKR